ncbi:DUF397 domain-containing protein [Streptomyces lincolnensis]|nr:DUF397 domain-containing protein [Streptomyces lincolnensis]
MTADEVLMRDSKCETSPVATLGSGARRAFLADALEPRRLVH